MAELFERHDRSRFEITAFSFGPDRRDPMRARLSSTIENFLDVRVMPDSNVAMEARRLGIDIAVDLKGYCKDSRTGIFAHRAAPVQVSYLGYPGTMGTPCIDYLIADATIIPGDHRRHYSESIVYLPDSYQPNDTKREISDARFSREEMGLPSAGFVFCCFNNNFKILPATFERWMRMLRTVEGSVLWLLEDNPAAAGRLRREAAVRGVDPGRLVFAPRMPTPEHLARHRLADLFLDTLPCNAHTTASDALWAGLPVLTCPGETFAGRVAASLLNAIRLPELIARTPEEYESFAIELARSPGRLAELRRKLEINRPTAPLFDIALFTRHLESGFAAMHERCQANLQPADINISG
jgi:predicted O-linked N-acetylglucosamine transferase (SPINDLY family)